MGGLNKGRLDRSREVSKGGGGGDIYKWRNGRNVLRLMTFEHKVTKMDFETGLYKTSDGVKVGDTQTELDRLSPVHFRNDKGINCMLKDCEMCAEADEFKGSRDKKDQEQYRKLAARKTFWLNVVDTEHPENGVQMCGFPPSVFNEILDYIHDPDFGEEILGIDGRDLVITRDTNAAPQDMYSIKLRDKDKSVALDEGIEEGVQDLYMVAILEPGWSSDEDLRRGDAVSGRSSKKDEPRGRAPARKPADEDEERPSRGSGRNDFKDDDDTPDSEDDLPWEKNGRSKPKDEPASRSGRRAAKPAEDDEPPRPEIPAWVKKGGECSFKHPDTKKTVTGEVVEINVDEFLIGVEFEDEIFDIEYIEAIKPGKGKEDEKPRRRTR